MADRPAFPIGMSFDQRLVMWQEMKRDADHAVALERRARTELFGEKFKQIEGVQTFDLGNGYELKGELPHNYTLANKENETFALCQRWQKMGGEAALLAARLINWKPELRVGEYKKLPESMSQTMDSAKVLTIKPGQPTITIKEPKG